MQKYHVIQHFRLVTTKRDEDSLDALSNPMRCLLPVPPIGRNWFDHNSDSSFKAIPPLGLSGEQGRAHFLIQAFQREQPVSSHLTWRKYVATHSFSL